MIEALSRMPFTAGIARWYSFQLTGVRQIRRKFSE
jgi:hypothetical protein